MINVSETKTTPPEVFKTELQKKVYHALGELQIPYERVDTGEVITMDDCAAVNKKLNMKMVKTLFLCNRQQTEFYLFVTCGDKPFRSKDFSTALGVARVSFAPADLMETMLGTKIGAATIFSSLLDTASRVKIVFDKDVLAEEYYGCSDGTTTGYMKVKTEESIHSLAGGAGSRRGTGGMKTKLQAASLAAANGTDTVITNGKNPEAIYEIIKGNSVGTLFIGKADR